jgi:2-dehydro-3-deoxy-phosphogluconate aldolase
VEENILKDLFSRLEPIRGRVLFLVPALNFGNAVAVNEALEGTGIIAVSSKNYPSAEALAEEASKIREKFGVVSIALGGGDYTQTDQVINASLLSKPDHINMPFELASYAQGRLDQAGLKSVLVNALVLEAEDDNQVAITVDPFREDRNVILEIRDALSIINGWGIKSVKALFTKKDLNLNWLSNIARASEVVGLELIEPSSGINFDNVNDVLRTCLEHGSALLLPHVFGALIDKRTGLTKPEAVRMLVERTKRSIDQH